MQRQDAVLAIDEGTTGVTCLVVSADGRVLARAYREISQHYPAPGLVEHDATEIFERTCAAAREALAQANANVIALGITNQRETIVLWDRETGQPVHRAIVWQDRRTAARCAALAPEAELIQQRTGLVTDPYFSATKLEWLLHERGLLATHDTARLLAGTIDTWLIWKLTNGASHVTDHTNASRTMLYDIDARGWSEELCALFRVPPAILPDIRSSSGDFGRAQPEHLGLALPILGVAGDQQAALFGQACWTAGMAKNTYGTGAFLLMNTGSQRPRAARGLLTTIGCDAAGAPVYVLEAAIFVAGAAIQWLRDGLGLLEKAEQSEAMAASLASNDGVYFVPALVGLGAPWWEPEARGTIVGLTRGTTRAHFARAALEAMAYGTADVIDTMTQGGSAHFERLRVDGGASANNWLMQFQADVLGVPVERPANVDTTAFGAAGLAGLAAGLWRSAAEFHSAHQVRTFTPAVDRGEIASLRGQWGRAVSTALHWAQPQQT